VLNEEYKERPTFTELCELLQDDRKIKELEGRRILMEIVARNKEGYTKLLERLFKELQ